MVQTLLFGRHITKKHKKFLKSNSIFIVELNENQWANSAKFCAIYRILHLMLAQINRKRNTNYISFLDKHTKYVNNVLMFSSATKFVASCSDVYKQFNGLLVWNELFI